MKDNASSSAIVKWLSEHPTELDQARNSGFYGAVADLQRKIAKELGHSKITPGTWYNATKKFKKESGAANISPEVRRAARITADKRSVLEQGAIMAGIPVASTRIPIHERLIRLERLCQSLADELGINSKE